MVAECSLRARWLEHGIAGAETFQRSDPATCSIAASTNASIGLMHSLAVVDGLDSTSVEIVVVGWNVHDDAMILLVTVLVMYDEG